MRIELPSGTPAELARPEAAPTRGVVLAPDIAGLRPLFDDLVARLAHDEGWAVIAPEPWPGQQDLPLADRLERVGTLRDERLVGDCVAAAAMLDVEPVAVVGFCMGGMIALKAAASGRFDRAVSFYGMIRMPDAWRSATMADALDLLLASPDHAPVLHLSGTNDAYVPEVEADALRSAGGEVVRYEGADHGFVHDASRPTHRAEEAADAWQRVRNFLETR